MGSLFLAGGFAEPTIRRRKFDKSPHSKFRLFDPQLYLASLDKHRCRTAVQKLASYPWFGVKKIPKYDSNSSTQREWKENAAASLLKAWPGVLQANDAELAKRAEKAVQFQLDIGVSAVIAPAPLIASLAQVSADAANWWDASINASKHLSSSVPLLATVAVSDYLFRGEHSNAQLIIDQLLGPLAARRRELGGVYLVIEQSSVDEYSISDRRVVLAMMQLIDRVANTAGLPVVVGPSSLAAVSLLAAGASSIATGYYRSLRRIRLADSVDKEGRAYPRFSSSALLGDIGVERDAALFARSQLRIALTETPVSNPLLKALTVGSQSRTPTEWEYSPGNVTAAWSHYLWVAKAKVDELDALTAPQRKERVRQWLNQARRFAEMARATPGFGGSPTEIVHQAAWEAAFLETFGA
jgi:hypothetical protein